MSTCPFSPLSERLKVFISSAQAEENGFAWSDVRRRIKDRLSQCACLNPYIIEDDASHIPSTQLYQMEVARSDIYILLLKGEVRQGTLNEYSLAKKYKKPMLVYFLQEEKTGQDVQEIRNDIINRDLCTFHSVRDFDKIEEVIWKHLMANLVRDFQYNKSLDSFTSQDTEIVLNKTGKDAPTSLGIVTKPEIAKFNSCYNYLFDLLDLHIFKNDNKETMSECHDVGCSLIKWLVTGEYSISDGEIKKLISVGEQLFDNKAWLQKRWNAINASMLGDTKKALSQERQALKLAKEASIPDWIINNILIDCRNMEVAVNYDKRIVTFNGKYQSELNQQDTMICFPIADRYLNSIFEIIEKDERREKTASPYTVLFGSSLPTVLTDLANYMFSAAIYGSETHLQLSRKVLHQIFDHYSFITNDPEMKYEALKQLVLLGDISGFNSYIKAYWDEVYPYATSNANTLWTTANSASVPNQDLMKLSAISALGMYLSDEVFKEAEQFVYEYSKSVYWGNSERYFEAIYNSFQRLNANRIIESITPIIEAKRFSSGNKLSHIILYMNLDKVNNKNLKLLSEALKQQLPAIIERNGDPQMIAVLVNRNKDLFTELEHVEGNGLSGYQLALYRINQGSENWASVLEEEIRIARSQFDANKQGNTFHGFMHDPYSMVSNILRRYTEDNTIDELLVNDFISLAIDVLNSSAPIPTKIPCVSCLCELFGCLNRKNIQLPDELKNALSIIDVNKEKEIFSSESRKTLEIRLIMAQILAGIKNINSLLQWCIDFSSFDIKNKIAIIECIEQYYYHNRDQAETMNLLTLSIALQCSTERYSEIRRLAIKCLSYASTQEAAIIALNKAVYDPSEMVRSTLLKMCKDGSLPIKTSSALIKSLKRDANYIIRRMARERKGEK